MTTITPPTGRATRDAASDEDWRDYALCSETDPAIFFPEGVGGQITTAVKQAKQVCGRCEVRSACLQWALSTRQTAGVWGGLTTEERCAPEFGASVETVKVNRPTAVDRLLATRRKQIQRLLALGEPVGVMALELRTNAQTVKKILARLEAEKTEEVPTA